LRDLELCVRIPVHYLATALGSGYSGMKNQLTPVAYDSVEAPEPLNPPLTVTSFKQQALAALRRLGQTMHGRIVLLGLVVVLCYLPTWMRVNLGVLHKGGSDFILNIGMMALAGREFWQHREEIAGMDVMPEDRWMGYALMGGGLVMVPVALHSSSFHALATAIIVASLLLSSWGVQFFLRFPLAVGLLLMAFYPALGYLANQTWRVITPHNFIENNMAVLGSMGLRAIGYQATADLARVSLPEGAVLVASGCSGFDMSFTLAATGWLMGLFYRLRGRQTLLIMVMGVAVSLTLNVPRIMLLTISSVHWGKASFEFWHGPIGGQIFASILFTIFYYMVMWVVNGRKKSVSAN
jgi:exosortase/archaeosortase family protein